MSRAETTIAKKDFQVKVSNYKRAKDIRAQRIYGKLEPTVIDDELLTTACFAQGPTGEAGKLAEAEGIAFSSVKQLSLAYNNILKIGGIEELVNITTLKLDNNIIEKIEGLDYLVNIKWLGSREIMIPRVESHVTLYYSGPRDSSGRNSLAIALSQQADLALLVWEPVSDRMANVRLKGHITSISNVSIYAPTLVAEQRYKEAFYSHLQASVERLLRRDLLILAGDWNGQTGPGDLTTSHLLGRFELSSRCENDERLLNLPD
ncbi:Dynein regulatory complex subunit 3 [Sparganum proliferum]